MDLPPKDYAHGREPAQAMQDYDDDEPLELDRLPIVGPLAWHTIIVIGFCALMLGWFFWTGRAGAQQPQGPICAPYGRMQADLQAKFKERVSGIGIVSERAIVQLFVSESGSWTFVAVSVDGQACVVSAGQGWEQLPVPAKGEPS